MRRFLTAIRPYLFQRPPLFARGIAILGAGLIWGFMPGLTIMGTPIDPRRYIVGLVIAGIGAIMCIVGVIRRSR